MSASTTSAPSTPSSARSTDLPKALLILAICATLAACAAPTHTVVTTPPTQGEAVASTSLQETQKLLAASPLGTAMIKTTYLMQASCGSMMEIVPPKHQEALPLLQQAIELAFSLESLQKSLHTYLNQSFSPQELHQIAAWQAQPANARMIRSTQMVNHSSPEERLLWWADLPADQRTERITLAKQLVPAYISRHSLREVWVSLFSNAAWMVLQVTTPEDPTLKKQMRLIMASAVRSTGLEKIKIEDLYLGMAYALQEVSMEDQQAFADFWSSSLGHRYHNTLWQGYPKALEEASAQVVLWLAPEEP